MVNSVLLPDPLAPMTATREPGSTHRSTSWRAWTCGRTLAVDLRDLRSSSMLMIALPFSVATSASGRTRVGEVRMPHA